MQTAFVGTLSTVNGWFINSLALVGVLLAHVGTVEELSIEELNSYHSKDEVEEQVDDQDVEDVFQWVDDAVKDGFQLGNPFDGLKRPQDAKHTKGLHRTQIFTAGASTKKGNRASIKLHV